MEARASRGAAGVVGPVVLLVGGALMLVGVALDWARGTASFVGGEILGQPVTPELLSGLGGVPLGPSQELAVRGTSDWRGLAAGLAGLGCLALGLVALVLPGRRGRPYAAAGTAVGAFAVLPALLALGASEAILREELASQAKAAAERVLGALPGLGLGGLLDPLIEQVIGLFAFDASPGPGVYASGVGSLVAVAGGAAVLLGAAPDRIREAAARMDPAFRAELLSVLEASSPTERAEAAARLGADPAKRPLAELVRSLDRDERTRGELIAILREMERDGTSVGPSPGEPPSPSPPTS